MRQKAIECLACGVIMTRIPGISVCTACGSNDVKLTSFDSLDPNYDSDDDDFLG